MARSCSSPSRDRPTDFVSRPFDGRPAVTRSSDERVAPRWTVRRVAHQLRITRRDHGPVGAWRGRTERRFVASRATRGAIPWIADKCGASDGHVGVWIAKADEPCRCERRGETRDATGRATERLARANRRTTDRDVGTEVPDAFVARPPREQVARRVHRRVVRGHIRHQVACIQRCDRIRDVRAGHVDHVSRRARRTRRTQECERCHREASWNAKQASWTGHCQEDTANALRRRSPRGEQIHTSSRWAG